VVIKLAEQRKEQPQICDIAESANGMYEMQGKFQHSQLKAGGKERENDNCQLPCIVIRLACYCLYKEAVNGGVAYGVEANCSDIPSISRSVIGRAEENTCLHVCGQQLRMCIKLSWTADRRLSLHVHYFGTWLMSPNSISPHVAKCCRLDFRRAFVYTTTNIRVPQNAGEFLD